LRLRKSLLSEPLRPSTARLSPGSASPSITEPVCRAPFQLQAPFLPHLRVLSGDQSFDNCKTKMQNRWCQKSQSDSGGRHSPSRIEVSASSIVDLAEERLEDQLVQHVTGCLLDGSASSHNNNTWFCSCFFHKKKCMPFVCKNACLLFTKVIEVMK
jgi:hypothetical protein